jgi:leader peptidase (prepilin peptidase)/N-methyltransferase
MLETFEYMNSDFPMLVTAMIFIFGAAVGSFLNVCIYRIPMERSIVFPGSTCACGAAIAWYHNIPILSWCFLRGRAACCGATFSIRYPMVELLTASLFAYAWWVLPPTLALIGMLYIALLICSTFIDLDHMIIPDRFSIGGMLVGVLLSICFPELHGIEATGLGEIVFRKPAMGEGDVKFVGFIGAFCGWQGAVFAMFGGALIGSIVLLPLVLLGRICGWGSAPVVESPAEGTEGAESDTEWVAFGTQVPFGPMLAGAGLIYYLGFSRAVDAYLDGAAELFFGALRTFQ